MSLFEIYLLAPAVIVLGTSLAVVLTDLFVKRKEWLFVVVYAGLLAALAVTILQWATVSQSRDTTVFGGSLEFDTFAVFFEALILVITLVVLAIGHRYLDYFKRSIGEYLSLTLFAVVGMLVLGAARELVTMYIAFELAALPLAALPAITHRRPGVESAIKFLILSAVGSATLLFGAVLLYAASGTTVYEAIQAAPESALKNAGVVFVLVGLGFKMSVFPAHMWVPDVYRGSPILFGAFLSTASKTAAFAAALALVGFAVSNSSSLAVVIGLLAVFTMFYGNLGALKQRNFKRLIGYSTIAHAGYMLVGVAAVATAQSATAVTSVAFYLAAYAATNLAAFFVLIKLVLKSNDSSVASLRGIGRRSKIVSLILLLAILSLLGVPPTAGFVAKLWVFGAAANEGLIWLAVIGAVNSVISAVYYLRIVRLMMIDGDDTQTALGIRFDARAVVGGGIAIAATIALGILSAWLGRSLGGLQNIFGG